MREKVEQPCVEFERSQSSVELKRDSKGSIVFAVKVYADEIDEALVKARAAFDVLNGEYRGVS